MVAYICTEETIIVILDGMSRTIRIKSKAHRNEIVIALEKYKKSPQTEADKKRVLDLLSPINRCVLKSDGRFVMLTECARWLQSIQILPSASVVIGPNFGIRNFSTPFSLSLS